MSDMAVDSPRLPIGEQDMRDGAEAVETERQLPFWRGPGYDEAHGYRISQPLPALEFPAPAGPRQNTA